MVVVIFLVDTSASMNQKSTQGTSYLDLAKNAIFTFMKYRARDPASRTDRYMLVSFDDPPSSIKIGLSHWHPFANELKNLHARGISTFSRGLRDALDLLNVQRLQTGIDQYGQGRNPFFLDPAMIISITDGGKYMKNGGSNVCEIENEVLFPPCGSYNGSELTKEMFRWDQRLFTVLLRIPGLVLSESAASTTTDDDSDPVHEHFMSLCEYTGGKCYTASSVKSLYQAMESISQKLHPGVVLNFRKIASEEVESTFHGWKTRGNALRAKSKEGTPMPPVNGQVEDQREISPTEKTTSWHNVRKMIYVRSKSGGVPTGHWPIPESFWPDMSNGTLPPRDVHPVVWFDDRDVPPMLLESFAFDKYEMEPSPLTQQLLEKRNPNICWEVFISDSGRERGLTYPFGYLKASSSGNFVNLFVMPFNYRKLIPLIEELQKQRLKPSSKWRAEFVEYTSTLPSYYAQPLRKALQLMGAHPGLVPDSFDGSVSYTITNYLRKLKKQSEMDTNELSRQEMNSNKKSSKVSEINGISVAIGSTEVESLSSQSYRNPFDIARPSLLEQVSRMRTNFLHSSVNTPHLIEEVDKHQVPIGQMGNYQQYLKKLDPLRELDTGAVRTQLFGNPFKLEKPSDKINLADEMMVEHMKRPGSPTREPHRWKRRSSRSPTPTPHTSPSSSLSLPVPEHKKPQESHITNSKEDSSLVNQRHAVFAVNDGQTVNQKSASSRDMDSVKAMEITEMDSSVSERMKNDLHVAAVVSSEPTTKESNLPVGDKLKDKIVTGIRKRSPSPTSLVPPPSKRNNRELVRNETSTKLTNDKQPLPSPLLTPVRQTGLSSASQVLNEEFKRKQTTQNLKLKQAICKEIRKNNKNHEVIFQSLESVQGTLEAKKLFVKDIIKEAQRFRKKQLMQSLEDWLTKLSTSGSKGMDVSRTAKNSSRVNAGQR